MRPGRPTRRTTRLVLVLAGAVGLLAGCVRSDLTVTVNDDGSGTYTAIVAINPKAIAELSKSFGGGTDELGDDPCKQIRDDAKENQGELPSGAKVENYSDGDFCGVKITAPFEAGDNPSEAIQEMLGGVDANDASGIGLENFSIEKQGNGWVFEATPPSSDDSLSGGDASFAKQFLQGAYSIVRIKLPGRVVEKDSNPDAIDGNGTLIWNINLTGETRTVFKARTEPGSAITNKTYTDAGKDLPATSGGGGGGGDDGGSSTVPILIGVLVVVAAIVGFVLWRKSKAKGAGPAAPGAAAPVGAWSPPAAPAAPPSTPAAPAPTAPAVADDASAGAAPAAVATAVPGEPQWDAARNAYILWDAGSSKWLQYDNAAGAWKPIDER